MRVSKFRGAYKEKGQMSAAAWFTQPGKFLLQGKFGGLFPFINPVELHNAEKKGTQLKL